MESLKDKEYLFVELPQFALDRSLSNRFLSIFSQIRKSFGILPNLINLYTESKAILYINLGQSYASFLRIIWWYAPLLILKPNLKTVISLHGSNFMHWNERDFKTRLFKFLLISAKFITVLGPNQKSKLLELGLKNESILVIQNTCELECITSDAVKQKHRLELKQPVNLLHLSLLIESKGFPEYLEALEILSKENLSRPLNAVLCGPMSFTQYCQKLRTPREKSDYITSKIKAINNSPLGQVHLEWIRGAQGVKKEELFNNSQIFIFPSYFPVEAQPLVLLEAMSKGCAIITSAAGEIPSTVSEDSAIIIHDLSPTNIAHHIMSLMDDNGRRTEIALEGLSIAKERFSIESYSSSWDKVFHELKS